MAPTPNNVAEELVVPGDGQAYIAAFGATLPAIGTDPTADLDDAFEALGYWTVDGATFVVTPDVQKFEAFQAATSVRSSLKKIDATAAFVMEQWNDLTVPTALGGAMDYSGAFPAYIPPTAGDALQEWSVVIDLQDGDRNMRWVYPRSNTATEAVTAVFKKDDLATLPVTVTALEPDSGPPYYINFDDGSAFVAGS